jgi:osmotically-inducible protein OsmY
MNRDIMLRTQIKEALNQDQQVAADAIAVESRRGIVTLSGCAASDGAVLAAVQIAASFPTCRGVVNRQIVRRPQWKQCEFLWGLPTGIRLLPRSA